MPEDITTEIDHFTSRVHLHVFGPDCPEVIRHRMFRDWLVAHPEDLERDAAAKRLAASQMAATGDDNSALGFGMRYNRIKEPELQTHVPGRTPNGRHSVNLLDERSHMPR